MPELCARTKGSGEVVAQVPRIVKSCLSDRWFVVTRYREKRGLDAETGEPMAYLVATTKFDVTDQMTVILNTPASQRGRSVKGEPHLTTRAKRIRKRINSIPQILAADKAAQ